MLARRLLPLCLAALLALPACKGRVKTYPVTGKLTIAGNPKLAEHATVVFHPIDESSDGVRPRAKVAADGTFTLTTFDGGDGAPAGRYRVTVEQWLSSGRDDAPPNNRLPAKFSKPDSSGLTRTVEARATDLEPIDLRW